MMAIPANLTSVVLRGTFITPEGDPSTGTISFTPSSWLINSGANVSIPNSTITKTLGTAGDFEVTLPVTDDADVSPGDWVYSVSEVVDGVSQNYNILLPGTVGGTAYLADIAPAAAAGPEYYSLASSLTIGTVTTLAEGASATADITGLAPTQVLDLGIPVGATGTVASAGSGSVGTAAIAAAGDPNTGIYFPAADQVAITTGGTAAATFAAGAIANPTFTGQVVTAAGTVSAPAISPTGDSNTGIFFPAADTVAIAEGGVEVLRVNSSGQVVVPAGSAGTPAIVPTGDTNNGVFFPAADVTAIATSGAERVRVDSSGFVGIGMTPTTSGAGSSPSLHVTTAQGDGIALWRGAADVNGQQILFHKTRNTTPTSHTSVADGDQLGQLQFYGSDGTGWVRGAFIRGVVDGTVSSGDVPGRVVIFTKPVGGSITERFRVDSNGLITGTGTSLGAWTSYTPTLTNFVLGNGTMSGVYCQVGKVVMVRLRFTAGSTSTFSGRMDISLPVTANGSNIPNGTILATDASTGTNYVGTTRSISTTVVSAWFSGATASAMNGTSPFTWTTDDTFFMTFTYEAA